jgi:hypothetical protein
MTTLLTATTAHSATIASLWNAKRLDANSCWQSAAEVDAAYIDQLLASGMSLVLAKQGEVPIGFGLWCASGGQAWLVALAADDEQVYYRLLAAFCEWGLAAPFTDAFAELGTAATTERARMDALEVIAYTTIGFEPLEAGQSPEERVPRLLRADCSLSVLSAALASKLEETP